MIGKTVLECTFNWHPEACSKTESMWSLLQKFSYWNRATTGEIRKYLLSSKSTVKIEIARKNGDAFNHFQAGIGISKKDFAAAFPASYSLFPREQDVDLKLRGCQVCLGNGFHSSLYQLKWIEFCPIHEVPLKKLRNPNKQFLEYKISPRVLEVPFGWPHSETRTPEGRWKIMSTSDRMEGYLDWRERIINRLGNLPILLRPLEIEEGDPYFIAHRLTDLGGPPSHGLSRMFAKSKSEYHVSTVLTPRRGPLGPAHNRFRSLLSRITQEIVDALNRTEHAACLTDIRSQPNIEPGIDLLGCPYTNGLRIWRQYWSSRTRVNELNAACVNLVRSLSINRPALRNQFIVKAERLIIWQHYTLISEWIRLFEKDFLLSDNDRYFFPHANGPLFWFDGRNNRLHWWFWESIDCQCCEERFKNERRFPTRPGNSDLFQISSDRLFAFRRTWWPEHPHELNPLTDICSDIFAEHGIQYPSPDD